MGISPLTKIGRQPLDKFNMCAVFYCCTATVKSDIQFCYYSNGTEICEHRHKNPIDGKPICYNEKACKDAFDNRNPEHNQLGMKDLHLKKIGNGNEK